MTTCEIDKSITLLSQISISDSDYLELIEYTRKFIGNSRIATKKLPLRDD